ncbi:hypothetical protein DsansV1_C05g0051641 [Dioscorea sansibarensis]
MGQIYLNEPEVLKEERNIVVEFEEECSNFAASELKLAFEKMVNRLSLLYLDAIQPENSHQFKKQSCLCAERLNCSDMEESEACSRAPLPHFPLNLRSSEFTFERSKHQKPKSENDLRDFIFEYFLEDGSEIAFFSPSRQKLYDLIEKAIKAKILLNSSFFLNLDDLDDTCGKLSESTCCSTQRCDASMQDLKKEFNTFQKQISELSISETLLVPCSSTNSTCSCQSTSSLNSSLSKGIIHCKWKGGIPCFVFTMTEDSSKVFIANSQKIESLTDRALDCVYLFHSVACSKKSTKNSGNYVTEFAAKMKVEDHSKQTKTPSSLAVKSKGLSKKVAEMFKPSPSFKDKSTRKTNELCFQYDELLQEPILSELCNLDGLDSKNCREYDFRPNLELAAIVVKDYQSNSQKRPAEGGWGLKFLETIRLGKADTSLESSSTSKTHNKRRSDQSMNVIIPAGLHGGPNNSNGGPSSLTERWKSGGHCECGGWDIGCPLTVLRNSILQEDTKSLDFFIEGVENGEPLLKVVRINEELHHIYFHPILSALQSFSIGVAILHTSTPSPHS